MKIKTLAEILAESQVDSASTAVSHSKKADKKKNKTRQNPPKLRIKESTTKELGSKETEREYFASNDDQQRTQQSKNSPSSKSKKRKKHFHPAASFVAEPNNAPAYQPPKPQSIQQILAEVKRDVHDVAINSDSDQIEFAENNQVDIDNLPSALKAYLRTPEQKQAEIDAIKAESRLRWLAFYYLSRREHGRAELKQKLLDKEQDPERIEALLDEFEEKGYQSDYRTTLMLIRENIRKGRGRGRIKQDFYRKKVDMPANIDELIDMANTESEEFSEFIDDGEDSLIEGVDWLKLAVTARIKKYGEDIPCEPKDKARQLRFLQYRGFKGDICFQALNHNLETLDERF